MKEKSLSSLNGLGALAGSLVAALAGGALFVAGVAAKASTGSPNVLLILAGLLIAALALVALAGLYTVQPNQAAVVSLFGKYVGTVKDNGLRWNNPFFSKRRVSQRVRNFESGKLKVNELDGSPIEIAAVIVWQVVDASEAVYNVDDYESFVHIQSESALRAMATSYPYDQHEDGQLALRSHASEISQHLKNELAERLADAGVQVIDAPRRCCSGSRPMRSSPHARASSPVRSAWSRWRWPSCRKTAWCSWTRSARRTWSATC